jgi:hypothetical protein
MLSTPRELSPIYEIWEEINRSQTISVSCFEIIGERLNIAFTVPEKKQRRSSQGQKPNYKSAHQRKKARNIYLDVFATDVHIFIPFILTISPRACEGFRISIFHQHHEKKTKIHFNDETLALLWRAARQYGCDNTVHFRKLMQLHTQMPPPVTGAEGKESERWSLRLSGFAKIRSVFGDVIFNAVRISPTEVETGAGTRFSETTTNVMTRMPRQQPQDAVISLHVGLANELANMLFPNGSQKIASALSTYSPIMPLTSSSQSTMDSEGLNSESSEIGEKGKCITYCND